MTQRTNTPMRKIWLLLTISTALLLAACNGKTTTPALGVSGQPTLVFVYTEN